MDHEETVKKILSNRNANGTLKSRESSTVEFKEAFNFKNSAKYAKTMAAFANNSGGYIIFGVKDSPREIIGLQSDNFDTMSQEKFSDTINSLFSPEINWDCGILLLDIPLFDDNSKTHSVKIGWIYTSKAEFKPIIAQKSNNNETINTGNIYYRYRARTEKIRFAEMTHIIEERMAKERESLLKIFDIIRKNETANLGIVNYSSGKISTPYGVDIAFDRKLVAQVLKKAKFIKEGSFNETNGLPVLKVTGNINMAEEVPVPDANPDDTHPYIQKQLAEKLNIKQYDLYALIWYYKMKEAKKYHIAITTSKRNIIHKFSEFAIQFLAEQLKELNQNPEEFEKIRDEFRQYKRENFISKK